MREGGDIYIITSGTGDEFEKMVSPFHTYLEGALRLG